MCLRGLILSFLFLLPSCGYHFGQGSLPSKYPTLCVPYVIGDSHGEVTAALIHELSASGAFEYRSKGASAILQVKILDFHDENVGFRYDRNKEGKLIHDIIPTETRLRVLTEVVLIDACSGSIILGPMQISAWEDFDHAYYSSRNGVNVFSLGQLTDIEDARDAAMPALTQVLVKKIVDFIANNW